MMEVHEETFHLWNFYADFILGLESCSLFGIRYF